MRKGILVGIAALACFGLVAGGALAVKLKKIETSVTLTNPAPGTYTGKVLAGKGCDAGRLVRIWHDNGNGKIDRPPPPFPESDFMIGEEVSDRNGNYTVTGPQAPNGDQIIAEVEQSVRKKKRKNCLRAKPQVEKATAAPG